jgi:hypothetical protein
LGPNGYVGCRCLLANGNANSSNDQKNRKSSRR